MFCRITFFVGPLFKSDAVLFTFCFVRKNAYTKMLLFTANVLLFIREMKLGRYNEHIRYMPYYYYTMGSCVSNVRLPNIPISDRYIFIGRLLFLTQTSEDGYADFSNVGIRKTIRNLKHKIVAVRHQRINTPQRTTKRAILAMSWVCMIELSIWCMK